jgi:hypothetical protein
MPSIMELIQAAGAIATVLAVPVTLFLFLRSRGRLKVEARWTDERGASGLLAEEINSITVTSTNLGQETVIVDTVNFEVRSSFGIAPVWEMGYLTFSLEPTPPEAGKLGAGERFAYRIPFPGVADGSQVLAGLSVSTTTGKRYGIGAAPFLGMRLQAYIQARRHRNAAAIIPPRTPPTAPEPVEPPPKPIKRPRTKARKAEF